MKTVDSFLLQWLFSQVRELFQMWLGDISRKLEGVEFVRSNGNMPLSRIMMSLGSTTFGTMLCTKRLKICP